MIAMDKIGILNPSPLIRLGLDKFLVSLNPRITGVRMFASIDPFLIKQDTCDLALLICDLSGTNTPEHLQADALKALCHHHPGLRLIVYSYNRTEEMAHKLEHSPQISLISRYETLPVTTEYFLQALDGFKVCSPLFRAQIEKYKTISRTLAKKLTGTEIRVLENLFQGISIAEMSYRFSCNVKTLSAQKRSAMRKLGVGSDGELFSLKGMAHNLPALRAR